MNGRGIYYWKNGDSWDGQFEDDDLHGTGMYRYADGTVEEVRYYRGEPLRRLRASLAPHGSPTLASRPRRSRCTPAGCGPPRRNRPP
jgi:hypothetical protein